MLRRLYLLDLVLLGNNIPQPHHLIEGRCRLRLDQLCLQGLELSVESDDSQHVAVLEDRDRRNLGKAVALHTWQQSLFGRRSLERML